LRPLIATPLLCTEETLLQRKIEQPEKEDVKEIKTAREEKQKNNSVKRNLTM
jgi:hypothetical protein